MAHRTLRSILTGGALIAALTLASPSPAHAATGQGFVGLWNWLAGSWEERVALQIGTGQPRGGKSRGSARELEKQGPCIDPNGRCASTTSTTGTTDTICRTWSEGICIDPNG
jgi:hypothetical protein